MAESHDDQQKKPHTVMVEFLLQGHITPFIHLALALASKGCTVTYVRTEHIHHQLTKAATAAGEEPESLFSGLGIRYMTISDGFPLDFDRTVNFVEFYESILQAFPARVSELVGKMVDSSDHEGINRPDFLVADMFYLWPPAVCSKYNLVNVAFVPSSVVRLSAGYHLRLLKERGLICSYGEYRDDLHGAIQGVRPSDVRDFIRYTPAAEDHRYVPRIVNENAMKAHMEVRNADFILCNTVQELELDAIAALDSKLQPCLAIGPTRYLPGADRAPATVSLRQEADCTEWLNTKPPGSVLFISFGSIARTSKRVVWEIANGLSISGVNFVWVLRTDAVIGNGNGSCEEGQLVPPGFPTDDQGLVVPWVDQPEVLSNPVVGGFLTHCGWNSLAESIWHGVPMLCHPIFMDHPTNRNMVVDHWKIGVNLCDKPPIRKEEVADKIKRLMSGGSESDEIRSEMKKVSRIVRDAAAINGSSDRNLDKFIKHLKDKITATSKDR